jgi:hypothetical protein
MEQIKKTPKLCIILISQQLLMVPEVPKSYRILYIKNHEHQNENYQKSERILVSV